MTSLVIDSATSTFQVGIIEDDRFIELLNTENDTVVGLFDLLEKITKNFKFSDVTFCEGPGKLIGIRSAAMFVRILKIMQPKLKVYSYNSLALASKIRNPLDFPDFSIQSTIDEKPDTSAIDVEDNDTWDNTSGSFDEDDIDNIEFEKSLKQKAPEFQHSLRKGHLMEDLVCVKKNQNEYYLFQDNETKLVNKAFIEMEESPVYCLTTNKNDTLNPIAIPMTYNIEDHCSEILSIRTENDNINIPFDTPNEFNKWDHKRHQ